MKKEDKNISICFATDNNYVPYVAVAISSILYNTDSFVQFCILDCGISNFNKRILNDLKKTFSNFTIEFVSIDMSSFSDFKIAAYITQATYVRFLLGKVCNFDKVIYLDSDLIVLDDIAELYNENLDNYVIGAVAEHENGGFNSGVLLVDLQKWREQEITEKLFELHASLPDTFNDSNDQTILNKFFVKSHKKLNKKYNVIHLEDTVKTKDIVIRHFAGWKFISNDGILVKFNRHNIFHYYHQKSIWTEHYFGEFWFFAKFTGFYEKLFNEFYLSTFEAVKNDILDGINTHTHTHTQLQSIMQLVLPNKYPKWFINFLCWFVIKEKNRKNLRRKYIRR